MSKENLFKCFCKSRESQAFYSKCLESDIYTEKEKELIYKLIKKEADTSKIIRECITEE